MLLKRSISYLAAGAALLILAFFYFPWIPTSVNGADVVSISGSNLAAGIQKNSELEELASQASEPLFITKQGDPKLYIIPGAALVALFMAVIGYLKPSLHSSAVSLLAYLVPSLFGMVVMLWKYTQIDQVAAEKGTEAALESLIVVSYAPGWYATFLGLGVLFAIGAILFLEVTAKPDKLAEAARLNSEKRATATATIPALDAAEQTLALLAEARKLIKAKRYHIAHEILEKLDHPTAVRWLEQLEEVLKRETQPAIQPIAPAFTTSELQVVVPAFEAKGTVSPDLVLAKLAAAKNMIATRRYGEARRLLATIDHPTAKRWLDKLDEVPHVAA